MPFMKKSCAAHASVQSRLKNSKVHKNVYFYVPIYNRLNDRIKIAYDIK